jgi:hypothetical protein
VYQNNPQLKGVALLPFQDPPEAATELRRAVKELGFLTAMIPANGLTKHVGDKFYWPVYEEAERLGVPLAVHGGNHSNYGMDDFTVYSPINGLGHPFGQMIAMSSFVFHGVFDAFPNLRIAFLEAGSAWVGLWMDRMDRSYTYHVDLDSRGRPIKLKEGLPSNCFRNGRVFVGCEGSERSLRVRSNSSATNSFCSHRTSRTRSVRKTACTRSRRSKRPLISPTPTRPPCSTATQSAATATRARKRLDQQSPPGRPPRLAILSSPLDGLTGSSQIGSFLLSEYSHLKMTPLFLTGSRSAEGTC